MTILAARRPSTSSVGLSILAIAFPLDYRIPPRPGVATGLPDHAVPLPGAGKRIDEVAFPQTEHPEWDVASHFEVKDPAMGSEVVWVTYQVQFEDAYDRLCFYTQTEPGVFLPWRYPSKFVDRTNLGGYRDPWGYALNEIVFQLNSVAAPEAAVSRDNTEDRIARRILLRSMEPEAAPPIDALPEVEATEPLVTEIDQITPWFTFGTMHVTVPETDIVVTVLYDSDGINHNFDYRGAFSAEGVYKETVARDQLQPFIDKYATPDTYAAARLNLLYKKSQAALKAAETRKTKEAVTVEATPQVLSEDVTAILPPPPVGEPPVINKLTVHLLKHTGQTIASVRESLDTIYQETVDLILSSQSAIKRNQVTIEHKLGLSLAIGIHESLLTRGIGFLVAGTAKGGDAKDPLVAAGSMADISGLIEIMRLMLSLCAC